MTSGQTATFSVTAAGSAPLSYQWKKNGTAITGATSASYTTPATTMADAGATFSVTITNGAGHVDSLAVLLSVNPAATAPAITSQPGSVTLSVGQDATFSVSASGTAPLSYQWFRNGNSLQGATTSTYVLRNVSLSDSGALFHVVVSNSVSHAQSNDATLTVQSSSGIARGLGLNVNWASYAVGDRKFADIMKTSERGVRPGGGNIPVNIDGLGWPTEDATIVLWRDNPNMNGTYSLSFKGKATVEAWSPSTVQNQTYDAATNTTRAQVMVTPSGAHTGFGINFTNTQRTATAATNTGITEIKLMVPLAPGSSQSYPDDAITTDQFKYAVKDVSILRYMQFFDTTANPHVNWSDRTPFKYASYARFANTPGEALFGPSWEFFILLSNAVHKDAWICIPQAATDDYVRQLALLLRDGDPSQNIPPLDPSIKVYLEYSNEVWNWNYSTSRYNVDQATAEAHAGDPYHYNYKNLSGDGGPYWMRERVARRICDASRIFRSVFGDAQMMTRIRPILASQLVYYSMLSDPLEYVEDAYIPAGIAGNLPVLQGVPNLPAGTLVKDLLWGAGGAAYYSPDNNSDTLTLDSIWEDRDFGLTGTYDPAGANWRANVLTNFELCRTYGLELASYEGGPGLDATGHSESVKAQAWADPRMTTEVVEHDDWWRKLGGGPLVYYTLTQAENDYEWNFLQDASDPSTPKMQALSQLASSDAPLATVGRALGTIPGNSFDLDYWSNINPNGTGDHQLPWGDASNPGRWTSYLFNVPTAGTYSLSARVTQASGQLVFYVDGVSLAPDAVNGNTTTAVHSLNLTKGSHLVRVKPANGTFYLTTLTLQ